MKGFAFGFSNEVFSNLTLRAERALVLGSWILDLGPCNDSLSPHRGFGFWILDFHLLLNSLLDLGSWILESKWLEYSSERGT